MLVINRNTRLAAAVFALAALLFCLAACETETAGDGRPETSTTPPPPGEPSGMAATVNVSGTSVRLAFSSDSAGTYYALLLPETEEAPDAAAVKAHTKAGSGPVSAGGNSVIVTNLSSGSYTAYIAVEDTDGTLSFFKTEGINAAPFTITGSQWYMGAGRLTFGSNGTVSFHEEIYSYTYNDSSRTGYVSGHTNKNSTVYDGKQKDDIINALGNFTVNIDGDGFVGGVTFANYRETGFEIEFTPTRLTEAANSLAGTTWWWRATSLFLEFLPNGKTLMFSNSGYYPHPHIYGGYWFDPEYSWAAYPKEAPVQVGYIEKADRVCSYSTSMIALGAFVIMYDFKDDRGVKIACDLYFPGPESRYHVRQPFDKRGYKSYGHRADFDRLSDE